MAIQITPNGNILVSGPLAVYEEQLLNKRLNATPKTIAKTSPSKRKSVKKESRD
jgi:hypothetical protein